MRILLDTNIIIDREDPQILSDNLKFLMRSFNDLKFEIVIHPLTIGEIKKDKNIRRREINESKVSTYSILSNPPLFNKNADFCSLITTKGQHDKIDNSLLYAVYWGAVDFLVTEDKGIHKKAFKLGCGGKVLSIDDALNMFRVKKVPITPPAIYEDNLYNLDIDDPIFDVLKDDYVEFTDWFEDHKKRSCLVYRNEDSSLGALLIYKDENEKIILKNREMPPLNRMKISTLVVSSKGNKIGEFFIQWATHYAIKKGFSEIYLTHFIKPDDYLVYLIEKYGFFNVGKNNYRNKKGELEDVFIKYLNPTQKMLEDLNYTPEKISQVFYPKFYDSESVNKFVVPINPEFHEKLFLDDERQSKLYEHHHGFIVEGNAIKKAYLTRAPLKDINPGDLLLFYRTTDTKAITCIGVVEKDFHNLNDVNEIIKVVGKRTVYSPKDIEDLIDESSVMILLFTFSTWIPNKIKLKKLVELDILKAHPQRIHKISHEAYLKLKKEGGIDEGFTIN